VRAHARDRESERTRDRDRDRETERVREGGEGPAHPQSQCLLCPTKQTLIDSLRLLTMPVQKP
jgi:hypothetical protein